MNIKLRKFLMQINLYLPMKMLTKIYVTFKENHLAKKYSLNKIIFPDFTFSNFTIKFNDFKYGDKKVAYFTKQYLNHTFNWLGSGWKNRNLNYKSVKRDGLWLSNIINTPHLKNSLKIWDAIIEIKPEYKPINWQLDIKSGFVFDSKKSFKEQRAIINISGVDIKNAWELARMQHLPQMVFLANQNTSKKLELVEEFKCQVLDFIMSNPLGMGVNWNCTMEVGIRVSNIIIAYDWFKQIDLSLKNDNYFKSILEKSISAHLFFIVNHFEYKKDLRANHYLGNIAGLTFITSYAIENKEINKWLAYCIQEVENETNRQFFKDGGNFEGSTSYHRLSAELITYPTALLEFVGKKRMNSLKKVNPFFSLFYPSLRKDTIAKFKDNCLFSDSHYDKIYNIGRFTRAIIKPNNEIVQIGDNDNGRLFKFIPIGVFLSKIELESKYENIKEDNESFFWDENELNHSSLLSTIDSFFNSENENSIEYDFINQLVEKKEIPKEKTKINYSNELIPNLKYSKTKEIPLQNITIKDIECLHFDNFGIIIFKNKSFFLSIFYGANNKSQISWGHQHNDKLSFDLSLNNKDIYFDPGTYCYSSNHKMRNKFRSNFNHNNIVVNNEEQNPFPPNIWGLFNYEKRTHTKLHFLSKEKVILSNRYNNIIHYRIFQFSKNTLIIKDYCNNSFEQNFNNSLLSKGYGKINKT